MCFLKLRKGNVNEHSYHLYYQIRQDFDIDKRVIIDNAITAYEAYELVNV